MVNVGYILLVFVVMLAGPPLFVLAFRLLRSIRSMIMEHSNYTIEEEPLSTINKDGNCFCCYLIDVC